MNNGSKLRIYNLLRGLSKNHEVTLLGFADQPEVNPEAAEIREISSKVKVIPWKEFNPDATSARIAMFSLKPRSIVDTFSPEMAQAITDFLDEGFYDLVIASQIQMAAYYPYFQNIPAVFEELEIGLFHDRLYSSEGTTRFRHTLTWFKLRLYLAELLDSFQACTVTSEQERSLVKQNFPKYDRPMEVIPNCLNMSEYEDIQVEKNPNTLIFTGPFKYYVNHEAMTWFVGKVFPLILEQIPDVNLIITGDNANKSLPSTKNIKMTGYIDGIKGLIASSSVSIAPLLSGGGTRLKILEALALGTPVVSTSKGAEGLDVSHGENILLGDNPADFANHVISLLNDDGLYQMIAKNAKNLVRKNYDWRKMSPKYEALIESALK